MAPRQFLDRPSLSSASARRRETVRQARCLCRRARKAAPPATACKRAFARSLRTVRFALRRGASQSGFGGLSGGLARAQPFDFDMACGMGLIQSEVFNLDARERAFTVATGIYADATAVDVDAEAARTPVFWKIMRRRVAKETEL